MKKSLIYSVVLLTAALSAVSCEEKEPEVRPVQLDTPALALINSTSSSFTVGWAAVENASSYVYTLNGQQEETTSELSVTYEDLTPGEYVLKVKAVATNPEQYPDSGWAEITVTIAVNKLTTPTLTVIEQTAASFTVGWEAVENAASYAYTVNDGMESTTSELFFMEEGLSAGEYFVKVKAVASEDGEFTDSDWAEISVCIDEEPSVEKKLPGLFSVGNGKQIRFAQGNLQYNAAQDVWRFANNQYDVIAEANDNAGPDYADWIDLFSYGYSGYDGKKPYEMPPAPEILGSEIVEPIAGTDYDWGVYNPISNGGNEAGLWRTPTFTEMYYLFHMRENADKLFALATVVDVQCLIIFPDGFTGVDGVDILMATDAGLSKYSDDSYYYSDYISGKDHYKDNVYDAEQWRKLEEAGAVLLPNGGYRDQYGYSGGYIALYWLSESYVVGEPSYMAGRIAFSNTDVSPGSDFTWHYGQSVRLVQDVTGN